MSGARVIVDVERQPRGLNFSSIPGGRSFPLATGCVTEVGAGSGAMIGRSAAGAGVDVGQDQDGTSGTCVREMGFRHSASRDAMWGTLKCHRSQTE